MSPIRPTTPRARLLVVAAALASAAAAYAAGPEIPIVTTDEVKALFDQKADFVLADALSPVEFAELHIQGAINVTHAKIESGLAKLPADRSKRVVFYCKGPMCTKSRKAADAARARGYTAVSIYNEGLPEWVKRGYPVFRKTVYVEAEAPSMTAQELKALLDKEAQVQVVDIRDREDWLGGRIKGAVHVDLEVLDARLATLSRAAPVVVVDLHGKQSSIAARFLLSKGFPRVSRLEGGVASGWVKAGLPLEK